MRVGLIHIGGRMRTQGTTEVSPIEDLEIGTSVIYQAFIGKVSIFWYGTIQRKQEIYATLSGLALQNIWQIRPQTVMCACGFSFFVLNTQRIQIKYAINKQGSSLLSTLRPLVPGE